MADAMICATALHYQAPLVTSDANLPGVTLV
jgi:predicted nucleic acid-binding protein